MPHCRICAQIFPCRQCSKKPASLAIGPIDLRKVLYAHVTPPGAVIGLSVFCPNCRSQVTQVFARGGSLSGRSVYQCRCCQNYFYVYHPAFPNSC